MKAFPPIMRSPLCALAASLALVACGSSNNTPDAGADAGSDVALDAATACSIATFAVTKEAFGDGTNGEWKAIGFDIDGLTSTAASTDVCMPNSGGTAATAYPDGNNGIDNSWGKNIMPLLVSIYPAWSADMNNEVQSGVLSTLYELSCLPPNGDVPSFSTKVFLATSLGTTPLLDGTDTWPVAPEFLSNAADADSATIAFASSSITGALFDSKPNQTFALRFPFVVSGHSTTIQLALHAARVQMTFSADRKSATGMIGGVIKTEDLVAEVNKVGYLLGECDQALFASLVTQIRQASDILNDGTQDPQKTCDGISIGLGFEVTQAQRGPVGTPAQMSQSCP